MRSTAYLSSAVRNPQEYESGSAGWALHFPDLFVGFADAVGLLKYNKFRRRTWYESASQREFSAFDPYAASQPDD
jgi:hypothetical protein